MVTVESANASLSERVLDHIGADTAIVALPHCRWTDGALLDLEAIEWLESRLVKMKSALVLVTHDRHALDRLTSVTRAP